MVEGAVTLESVLLAVTEMRQAFSTQMSVIGEQNKALAERLDAVEELVDQNGQDIQKQTDIGDAFDASIASNAGIKETSKQKEKDKDNRRKSFGGKSFAVYEHEEFEASESSEDDEDDELGSDTTETYRKTLSAVMQTLASHKGTQEDHPRFMRQYETSMGLAGCGKIITTDEAEWQAYRSKHKKNAKIMEKVAIGVFEKSITSGEVYDKYLAAQARKPRDGRLAFVSVRDAHHSSSVKMTRKLAKTKLKAMQFNINDNYETFLRQFNELCSNFKDLKDLHTGQSLLSTHNGRQS